MVGLPSLFPAFGLSIEDDPMNFAHNWEPIDSLINFNPKEWNNFDSIDIQNISKTSSATSSDPPSSTRKISHNASERDRRKKLNELYSTLRSLLPGTDEKKKLSIPSTVCHALKYIPQLQNQVERLIQRKEEILSSISKQSDDFPCKQKKGLRKQTLPAVSTTQIGDREVLIQICTSSNMKKCPFSQVLQCLEEEQLQIHSASTFVSSENKVFHTLHVQVKETQRVQCELLREKVLSSC